MEIDLSGTKDLIKKIIDKKMKLSGNIDYGHKEEPKPGGTISDYRKEEKDSKRLLTRSIGEGGSSSTIRVVVIFRPNECDKNSMEIYIRAFASNYMFFNIVKCNEKNAVSCANDVLTDFAEFELSEHLFKQPKIYDL